MTILSYSGGGRGRGRGAGRGRGSGRGGGSFYRGGGGGRGRSFRGSYNYQIRSSGNSFAAASVPPPSTSTKWVRPKGDTTISIAESGKDEEGSSAAAAAAVATTPTASASAAPTTKDDDSSSAAPRHSTKIVKQNANHHGMTKKGHNKLILSTMAKPPPPSSSTSSPSSLLRVEQGKPIELKGGTTLKFNTDDKYKMISTDDNKTITTVEGDDKLSESPHYDAEDERNSKSTNVTSYTDEILESKPTMSRRGHNKLVLKTTRRPQDIAVQQPLHQKLSDNSDTNDIHDPARNFAAGTFQPMKKLGRHKLVLNNTIKSNDQQNEQEGKGEASNEVGREKMGTSKVSKNRGNDADKMKIKSNQFIQPPPGHRSFHWNKNNHPNQNSKGDHQPFRRRNHQHHVSQHNVAKRIKVTVVQPSGSYGSDNNDDDEGEQEGGSSQYQGGARLIHAKKNEDCKKGATQEKLTDFAYRETAPRTIASRNHKRSWGDTYHRHRHDQPQPRRNMGLVRVQPDVKKTPICPFYLKGIECTDKFCRKRHDVPKQSAIPICMFFQKHGQCLKGDDCVFRHVKVNPRALVCPNFSLLGFCDDNDCKMKHVRSGTGGGR